MPDDSGESLSAALSRIGVGVIEADAEGNVEQLSPFAERFTGWTLDRARGEPIDRVFRLVAAGELFPGRSTPAPQLAPFDDTVDADEAVLVSHRGQRRPITYTVSPQRDADGRITHLTVAFADISERTFALLQLARRATHDPLTDLPNRAAFTALLDRTLAAPPAAGTALVHLDLDQFNLVNHTCGHLAGSTLLQWVASVLREEVGDEASLARLDRDVFGILLVDADETAARALVRRILLRLQRFQFSWGDNAFAVGASVGVVLARRPGRSADEAFSAADHACAQAKQRGGNQVHVCSLEDDDVARRRENLEWVARIKRNIDEERVLLFAQPIRPLTDRFPDGAYFEVLMRLTGAEGIPKSAGQAIQTAEHYHLMASVDRWVVRTTVRTLAALPARSLRAVRLCAINISAVSLHDSSLLELVHRELDATGLPASLLCFELTETSAVENLPQAHWLIGELTSIGCRFALDDFGSGLASYSHLKDLPVDFLKIAGGFVDAIVTDPLDRALVESINHFAGVLGMATIAEAVASEAAMTTVTDLGVDFAQGNWISPPVPLSRLLASVGT